MPKCYKRVNKHYLHLHCIIIIYQYTTVSVFTLKCMFYKQWAIASIVCFAPVLYYGQAINKRKLQAILLIPSFSLFISASLFSTS